MILEQFAHRFGPHVGFESRLRRIARAAVAYVDPGNYATNLQGGARFGYLLLWVVLLSNLMAMLVQTLSAKLGIATGKNLAEHCRDQFPRWLVWPTWALMELVAIATDLAEFLGAAVGFNLLFGISLPVAGVLTAVVSFLLLGLEPLWIPAAGAGHHPVRGRDCRVLSARAGAGPAGPGGDDPGCVPSALRRRRRASTSPRAFWVPP